jgi:hypothetical protein
MEKKLMEQLGMNATIMHREGEAGDMVERYKNPRPAGVSVPLLAGGLAFGV